MLTFLEFPKQPATSDVRNPQPAAARRSVRAYDQPRATARAALRVRSANNALPHRDLSPPAPGYRRDGSGSGRLDPPALTQLDAQFGALFHTRDFQEGRDAEAQGRRPVYVGE
jgi:hypothetical protein